MQIDWKRRFTHKSKARRPLTETEKQIFVVVFAICAVLIIYGYFTQNIPNESIILNFTGISILNFSIHGHIPIPRSIQDTTELLVFKSTALAFATSYYNQLLQIELAIFAALFGLYSLIFIEIVKSVNNRTFKNKKVPEWWKYSLLFLAILLFPMLAAGMTNMLIAFLTYQNLYQVATTYLTLSNYSSTFTSNFIANFTLTSQSFTGSNVPITYNSLSNAFTKFPSIANNSFNIMIYSVWFLIVILLCYVLYMALSRPINCNTDNMDGINSTQIISNLNPPKEKQQEHK